MLVDYDGGVRRWTLVDDTVLVVDQRRTTNPAVVVDQRRATNHAVVVDKPRAPQLQ